VVPKFKAYLFRNIPKFTMRLATLYPNSTRTYLGIFLIYHEISYVIPKFSTYLFRNIPKFTMRLAMLYPISKRTYLEISQNLPRD